MPEAPDHDQRLKVLLKEFFEQFFRCFFPHWAEHFDFAAVSWLDKEVFLAPPQGEKRQLDLVARVPLRPGAPLPYADCSELMVLIHIEVESRDSVVPLRPRMRASPERSAELHAEASIRIALSGENDWRRYLLEECLEAYANLDEAQREHLQTLLDQEPFREVRPLMITTFERGKLEGKL